jgi:hypothetical protein
MADNPNVIVHLTAPERFRTQARLAEAAGCKQHTISEKKGVNRLTHEQMRSILKRAPQMGVEIDAWDFFPEIASEDRAA